MSEKNIKARVIHKHDTEAHWNLATNFIPKQGEIIVYDIDSTHSYERFKIGDGTTNVNALPFAAVQNLDGYAKTTDICSANITYWNQLYDALAANTIISVSETSTGCPISSNLFPIIVIKQNPSMGRGTMLIIDALGNAWKGNYNLSNGEISAARIDDYTKIYDSGEITSEVNSISGIDVSGYKNLIVAIKCVNTENTSGTKSGSVIFTDSNDQIYAFNSFTNLVKNGTNISGAMGLFKIVDGFIVCENAMRAINAPNILSTEVGVAADLLAPVGSGVLVCTNPISTMTVSTENQSATHYYGVGSRVIVWGCKV